MNTIRLEIHGEVQGVGYRRWFCAAAERLNLRGWVRNRTDGSVEAEVCGHADELIALEAHCHQGPPGSKVFSVQHHALEKPSREPPARGVSVLPTL
jgi:acylphosphatase